MTTTNNREEYFKAYAEYSKILRTWFIAYGIGAPVLLLTNETVAKAVKDSGEVGSLAAFFLIGVALQVVLAAANKASMWAIYYGELSSSFKKSCRFKVGYWFSEQFWIDFVLDILTMFFFSLATWRWYCILVGW